jgi:hypothetical protein
MSRKPSYVLMGTGLLRGRLRSLSSMRGAGHFHQIGSRERFANGNRFAHSFADWSVEDGGSRFWSSLVGRCLTGDRRIRGCRASVLGERLSWYDLAFHCSPLVELQVSEAGQRGQRFRRTLSAHLTEALKSRCPDLAATFNASSCSSSWETLRPRAC